MIQIRHGKLTEIAEEYAKGILPGIMKRIGLYRTAYQVLFSGNPLPELTDYHIDAKLKRRLVNVLLQGPRIQNQAQFNLVTQGNLKPGIVAHQAAFNALLVYFEIAKNVNELILVKPNDTLSLIARIYGAVGIDAANKEHFDPLFANILDYGMFSRFAYKISSSLGLNACPYCNRMPIHTIFGKRRKQLLRPSFDHFISKSSQPLLGLSFFNLVPSCYYCNSSLKGFKDTSFEHHLHPYMEGFGDDIYFMAELRTLKADKSNPENYILKLETSLDVNSEKYRRTFHSKRPRVTDVRGNINLFRLNEVYQVHRDTVAELIVKCDTFNEIHADSLGGFFKKLHTDKAEFYRFYFGNYLNPGDMSKRPLAKLSRDIVLKELTHYFR